jgi:hypothetical protein
MKEARTHRGLTEVAVDIGSSYLKEQRDRYNPSMPESERVREPTIGLPDHGTERNHASREADAGLLRRWADAFGTVGEELLRQLVASDNTLEVRVNPDSRRGIGPANRGTGINNDEVQPGFLTFESGGITVTAPEIIFHGPNLQGPGVDPSGRPQSPVSVSSASVSSTMLPDYTSQASPVQPNTPNSTESLSRQRYWSELPQRLSGPSVSPASNAREGVGGQRTITGAEVSPIQPTRKLVKIRR